MWDGPSKRCIDCSGPVEDLADEEGTDAKLQDIQLDEAEDEEEASGAEEEENAEPAAKDGWNEDETQKDTMPEAGPQGLASQSAAAQVRSNTLAVRWPSGGRGGKVSESGPSLRMYTSACGVSPCDRSGSLSQSVSSASLHAEGKPQAEHVHFLSDEEGNRGQFNLVRFLNQHGTSS